ncbi:hypothetical protein M8C21_006439, partial [Ambrosia artemisiifolia]
MFWLGVSPEPLKRHQLLPDEDDEITIKDAAGALTTTINYALSSRVKANALRISQRLSSEFGVWYDDKHEGSVGESPKPWLGSRLTGTGLCRLMCGGRFDDVRWFADWMRIMASGTTRHLFKSTRPFREVSSGEDLLGISLAALAGACRNNSYMIVSCNSQLDQRRGAVSLHLMLALRFIAEHIRLVGSGKEEQVRTAMYVEFEEGYNNYLESEVWRKAKLMWRTTLGDPV